MTFFHPVSSYTEKEFSKIVDGVVRTMAEVNRKETLPNKEYHPEIDSSL